MFFIRCRLILYGGSGGYLALYSQLFATTLIRFFPFDRFTRGEALILAAVFFHSGLCFLEGTNERFGRALYAFGGALGNS